MYFNLMHACAVTYLELYRPVFIYCMHVIVMIYLFQSGTLSGAPQNPFGRTTSSSFSVQLAEQFHCVLSARIPRFPFSNDCITVWKRTNYVHGRGTIILLSSSLVYIADVVVENL